MQRHAMQCEMGKFCMSTKITLQQRLHVILGILFSET